jgi:hypothetical protein
VSCPGLGDRPDCAPNAFRRFIGPDESLSRQCIFALTRPGFTSKIPHPFHSRACFRTHDPVEEPYASRELARPVLKDSLSKASSERSYRHVVSTSAAHLHSFFKDEHRVSLATGFVPGLRPFLPGGAARFTASHPAGGVPATRTREHCPLSHPVSDRTSRRPVAPLVAQPAGLPPRDV